MGQHVCEPWRSFPPPEVDTRRKCSGQCQSELRCARRWPLTLACPAPRCTSRRVRDLWWQGLPPSVRGKVWSLAVGNELNITHGTCVMSPDCLHSNVHTHTHTMHTHTQTHRVSLGVNKWKEEFIKKDHGAISIGVLSFMSSSKVFSPSCPRMGSLHHVLL